MNEDHPQVDLRTLAEICDALVDYRVPRIGHRPVRDLARHLLDLIPLEYHPDDEESK